FHQGSGVATPFHEAGYTDAVVHRFEIKTNTGKPGGVHIRITPQALSADSPLLGVAPWGISPRGP
ncbi:hypothetical protein ACLPJK_11425, partial [Pseudomonas aeruginosa]|uniref:hypothetical protein n=2 Tax=Pseudomonas aeruginosa TaxID=287 RepID=UPI003D28883B